MKKLLFAGVATALALTGTQVRAQDTNDTSGSMGGQTGSSTGSTGSMGTGSTGSMGTGSTGTTGQTGTMGSTMGQTGTMDMNSMAMAGKVTNIDKKKNMVTLEVPISPTASVMREGKTVSIDQLKKGDDVRASFDPTTNAITQIQVAPKGTGMEKTQKDQMNR